jgi:hypothetical protein
MSTVSMSDIDVEENLKTLKTSLAEQDLSETSVLLDILKLYKNRVRELKEESKKIRTDVYQKQEQLLLLNQVISKINSLTDDENGIDISGEQELQDQLEQLRSLGVILPDKNKLKLNILERNRLVDNLHRASTGWEKEIKNQSQTMQTYLDESHRIIMIIQEVIKTEGRAISAINANIKGS